MEEKQLSILNAKQEEMETCRVQAVLGHRAEAGETSGSAGSSNSEIRAADTGRNRADYCMAEGTWKRNFLRLKKKAEELEEVFCKGRTGNAEKNFTVIGSPSTLRKCA